MSRPTSLRVGPERFVATAPDTLLYRALVSADGPMTVKQLIKATGVPRSTAGHTMRYFRDCGLVKHVLRDREQWYTWDPRAGTADLVSAITQAEAVAGTIPQPQKEPYREAPPIARPTPMSQEAQALRAIAALLMLTAERLEKE